MDDKTLQQALFKNILCYCLTGLSIPVIADYKKFKNILCYCLTNKKGAHKKEAVDLKTSYVIV